MQTPTGTRYFKLANGEDIICTVDLTTLNSTDIAIRDPVQIVYTQTENGQYYPQLVDWTALDEVKNCYINRNTVISWMEVSQYLTDIYEEYIMARNRLVTKRRHERELGITDPYETNSNGTTVH